MAELRRRQQGGTGGEPTADCDASVAVPTLVATAVDELLQQREKTQAQPESAPLLDSLHLSDSATADSSDHVSEASVWKNRTSAHRKLIDLCACVVFTLHRVGGGTLYVPIRNDRAQRDMVVIDFPECANSRA